jgi:hypothetical protein
MARASGTGRHSLLVRPKKWLRAECRISDSDTGTEAYFVTLQPTYWTAHTGLTAWLSILPKFPWLLFSRRKTTLKGILRPPPQGVIAMPV